MDLMPVFIPLLDEFLLWLVFGLKIAFVVWLNIIYNLSYSFLTLMATANPAYESDGKYLKYCLNEFSDAFCGHLFTDAWLLFYW